MDRPVFGNRVVALDPGDLLDQIDLARHIAPPTRRLPPATLAAGRFLHESQPREDLRLPPRRHRNAEHLLDPRRPQVDRRPAAGKRPRLDHAGKHLAASQFLDERRRPATGPVHGRRIGPALEAIGGGTHEDEPPSRRAHDERRELR